MASGWARMSRIRAATIAWIGPVLGIAGSPRGAQPAVAIDQHLRARQRIRRQPDDDGQRRPNLRLARDAGRAGRPCRKIARDENRYRSDIVRQRRFGSLVVGHRDDAQRTTAQIVEIDDLPVGTLRVELRHWQRLRPASGSTQGVAGVVRAQVVDQVPDCLAGQHTGEARHRDRTLRRREAVRDEPVEFAIAMRAEMVRGEIGRRQRQRPRGRTIAARLDAVADDAVRGEQSCAVRDRGGGELGGRGEEAGRIGSNEQQIEMRYRPNLDDHGDTQCKPSDAAPDHADDRDGNADDGGAHGGDKFSPQAGVIERRKARPPRKWPDRLLVRSRRERGEVGGDDDDKCTQHHLGRDGEPHELPRAGGGGEAIGEHKAIGGGEHEQHDEHPELHQRDVAVAGPQQS